MNILFLTFGKLSAFEDSARSLSFLRALVDAGHRVDLIAAGIEARLPSKVTVLDGGTEEKRSRRRLRRSALHAVKKNSYDVVHAVDDAVLFASRLVRIKKSHLVYDASRCFSMPWLGGPSWCWSLLASHYRRVEKRILAQSSLIISSNGRLSTDLSKHSRSKQVVQIEDAPSQALFPVGAEAFDVDADGTKPFIVFCRIFLQNRNGLKKVVLAARKVVEKVPHAIFYFAGAGADEVCPMAGSLDIDGQCRFLDLEDTEGYFSMLSLADVVLFVPRPHARYPLPEVMSFLQSSALLVAVHEKAYSHLLSDENCVLVNNTPGALADGILSRIRDPLRADELSESARKLVADHYSFSSFKHKVRMAYHSLGHSG